MSIRNMKLKLGKIKKHLRNMGRLRFKSKFEKRVAARKFVIKVEFFLLKPHEYYRSRQQ